MSPLGFKARAGSLIRAWWRRMCYTFPKIHLWCDTNLLVTSMAAEPSLPHTCEALVGLKTGNYHATTQSVYIASLCQFTNYIVDPVQPR